MKFFYECSTAWTFPIGPNRKKWFFYLRNLQIYKSTNQSVYSWYTNNIIYTFQMEILSQSGCLWRNSQLIDLQRKSWNISNRTVLINRDWNTLNSTETKEASEMETLPRIWILGWFNAVVQIYECDDIYKSTSGTIIEHVFHNREGVAESTTFVKYPHFHYVFSRRITTCNHE